MKGASVEANEKARKDRARRLALKLRPKNLTDDEKREWARIAGQLADPILDRLKPHFVDATLELVRVNLRLRAFRRFFAESRGKVEGVADRGAERVSGEPGLDAEIYMVEGRNGVQLKSHPHVAQMNEAWRQWRSLVAMFGLTPTDERNMAPGQASLFDPAAEFD